MGSAFLLGVGLLLGVSAAGVPVHAAPAKASVEEALPTPQFRRYGTADGLPSSLVYTAVQARDGSMWFGTKGGIARFDGVDFKVFRHLSGDPGSLYNNGISTLLIDRQGRLWAGGLDAGLNLFDADSGHFLHFGHDPADPHSLASDKVWSLAQTADGSLWVGTRYGLARMRQDGRFEHIANPLLGADPAAFGQVVALYVDPQQRLWIGGANGVFRRDRDGTMHPVLAADPAQSMDAWRIDGNGSEVRIATARGLVVIGPDGLAHRFAAQALPDTNVMVSTRDTAGRLWIGTQRGLFLQTRAGGPVQPVMDRPVLYGNLPGTWVWKLYVDREGGLWVALLDGGVAYLAPGWYSFSRYTHVPDDPSSLRDAVATTMARGRDGRHVWVGERGGRVDRLDPVTGAVEHVLDGLHGDVVGMTEGDHGELWVAVQGALYRTGDGQVERVDPRARMLKHPLEVEPGPDHRLYVRTFGEGLFRIDPDTLQVSPVPILHADDKALWGAQMTLENGVFWYASEGGLLRLDATHSYFEPVPGGPTGRSVEAFSFNRDGVWLATADGLEHYRFRGTGLALDRQVDMAQGWPSVGVVDMRVDAQQRVWIFGTDGLWRFDPGSGSFRSFGLQDGLSNSEFSRGYALMPSGNLYAPTLGGVIAFDPDRVCEQATVPPLALTRVRVRRHGVLEDLPFASGAVQVGWKDRELGVQARVFSYVDPEANRYRFRLRGLDSNWVDVDSRGEREFAGLGAGDYTLDVMATGADGAWGHLEAPLQIHVEAPPWARWWARLAYAAGLALAVCLVLWVWRRRLAQRHRIALAEQQRCLAEEASAAKTQFLATLSHEIRTPMTGVMGMAELLLTTPLRADQLEYTQAMQRSGGMLLKLLNDALDLARIEAGRFELEPAPFDPRQLIHDVAQLEIGQAKVKRLSFRVELADDLPARVIGDAVRIKQVLLNLANNALKFTDSGGVLLRASRYSEGLMFSVCDTGPGIPEASQARLFQRFEQVEGPQRRAGSGLGLAICRELVGMMGGSIELESRLAHGSSFHVRLPLQEPAPVALPMTGPRHGANHLHVLLVEDDAIVAAVIRGLLERQHHRVCYVANGLGALAELEQASFDVMLLDLDLPGVDGFQIARLIRKREEPGTRMPIIAITARSGGDDELRTRDVGMDGFLRKPFSGEELAEILAAFAPAPRARAADPA